MQVLSTNHSVNTRNNYWVFYLHALSSTQFTPISIPYLCRFCRGCDGLCHVGDVKVYWFGNNSLTSFRSPAAPRDVQGLRNMPMLHLFEVSVEVVCDSLGSFMVLLNWSWHVNLIYGKKMGPNNIIWTVASHSQRQIGWIKHIFYAWAQVQNCTSCLLEEARVNSSIGFEPHFGWPNIRIQGVFEDVLLIRMLIIASMSNRICHVDNEAYRILHCVIVAFNFDRFFLLEAIDRKQIIIMNIKEQG